MVGEACIALSAINEKPIRSPPQQAKRKSAPKKTIMSLFGILIAALKSFAGRGLMGILRSN
jgi:hypothetical protein